MQNFPGVFKTTHLKSPKILILVIVPEKFGFRLTFGVLKKGPCNGHTMKDCPQ